jgi:hypothetical protein
MKRRAKAAPRRKAAKRAEKPRHSRSTLEKLVADLVGRIDAQLEIAWSIAKVVGPTPQTIVCEFPMRRVVAQIIDRPGSLITHKHWTDFESNEVQS